MGGVVGNQWGAREAPPHQLAAALREQLQRFEACRPLRDTDPISSGCQGFDQLLPVGGIARGCLIECLGDGLHAGGSGALAMLLARQAAAEGGAIVVLDPRDWFYPPAAAVWGVDLETLVVVRAQGARDQLWAVDQALRCPAVAAVWAPLEQLDERDFRRLQLAAEAGGAVGLLIRLHAVRYRPSWSDIQLMIHPHAMEVESLCAGRRLRIQVTRCRGGPGGGSIEVEIDERTGVMRQVSFPDETSPVCSATQLAHPAFGGRSA